MFCTGVEGISTNDVIYTASVSHHVNLAFHWTIAHQGSQFTSCVCIYAQGYLPVVSVHNGCMKAFGEGRHGMQVSMGISLPAADRPINHLIRSSGPYCYWTSPFPYEIISPIPYSPFAMLLCWKRMRKDESLHLPHWTVHGNPISLRPCTLLSSFFILNSLILSLPVLSAHNGFDSWTPSCRSHWCLVYLYSL